MWTQDIDPLGDIALSASTALVLIVVFLVCLVGQIGRASCRERV